MGRSLNLGHNVFGNLDILSEEEKTNSDYKRLIDNLRTYSLFPYYLSKDYHETAKQELDKVNWDGQPIKAKYLYSCPWWFLKLRQRLLSCASRIKQCF